MRNLPRRTGRLLRNEGEGERQPSAARQGGPVEGGWPGKGEDDVLFTHGAFPADRPPGDSVPIVAAVTGR